MRAPTGILARRLRATLVVALVVAGCGGSGPSEPEAIPCGPWPDQAESAYVLPYEIGRAFLVGQGNCSSGSHSAGSAAAYAYDFLMPIGTPIVAARSGEVYRLEERHEDGDRTPGHENYINVLHDDGSIAGYVHLTRNGALVALGDRVRRGEVIGLSGDTGNSTEPHLHFHVQECDGCPTIPITFRNTRAHPQGLQPGQSYVAEPPE